MHRRLEEAVWTITQRALRRWALWHKPVSRGGEMSSSHDRFHVQTRIGVCWEKREQPFPWPDNQRMLGISNEYCGQQAKITPNHYNLDLVVTWERRENSVFWNKSIIMKKYKIVKQRNNLLLDMWSFRYLKGGIKGKHIRMQEFFKDFFVNCVGGACIWAHACVGTSKWKDVKLWGITVCVIYSRRL